MASTPHRGSIVRLVVEMDHDTHTYFYGPYTRVDALAFVERFEDRYAGRPPSGVKSYEAYVEQLIGSPSLLIGADAAREYAQARA